MNRPIFTFRQAQASYDLVAVLKSCDDMRLSQAGGDTLIEIVRGASCRFEDASYEKCYETIAWAALEALPDAEVAVGVLVANELQQGMWCGETKEFARAAIDRLRSAPNELRSATLRGLDILEDLAPRWEPVEYLLPEVSRLTRPIDLTLRGLCGIARSMDQRTRESVVAADYNCHVDKQLRALNEVLSAEDCRFPKNETWCPREAVELVAHVRNAPGFVCCTALLLANAIPTDDEYGWFDFRWENLASNYNALPQSVRVPILTGIRHLYEANSDFLRYSSKTFWDPVERPEIMIDFVELPEADN